MAGWEVRLLLEELRFSLGMPVSLTSNKIHLAQEFSRFSSTILLSNAIVVIDSDGKASQPSPSKSCVSMA